MMSEGVLGGLPTLEHSYVCLPWWGPSRASVRQIRWSTPANRSVQKVLHQTPPYVARASAIACWPGLCANNYVVSYKEWSSSVKYYGWSFVFDTMLMSRNIIFRNKWDIQSGNHLVKWPLPKLLWIIHSTYKIIDILDMGAASRM